MPSSHYSRAAPECLDVRDEYGKSGYCFSEAK